VTLFERRHIVKSLHTFPLPALTVFLENVNSLPVSLQYSNSKIRLFLKQQNNTQMGEKLIVICLMVFFGLSLGLPDQYASQSFFPRYCGTHYCGLRIPWASSPVQNNFRVQPKREESYELVSSFVIEIKKDRIITIRFKGQAENPSAWS